MKINQSFLISLFILSLVLHNILLIIVSDRILFLLGMSHIYGRMRSRHIWGMLFSLDSLCNLIDYIQILRRSFLLIQNQTLWDALMFLALNIFPSGRHHLFQSRLYSFKQNSEIFGFFSRINRSNFVILKNNDFISVYIFLHWLFFYFKYVFAAWTNHHVCLRGLWIL